MPAETPVGTVGEVASAIGGSVVGSADAPIRNIRGIEEAGEGDLSFVANPKYLRFVSKTRASALIVGKDFRSDRPDLTLIVVDEPYEAFIRALRLLRPDRAHYEPGIHPTAVIADDVVLGTDVTIGPHVVIEPGCSVGNESVILAGTVLLGSVTIGNSCMVYPNVTIYPETRIGNNVILHSGAVIGGDGFGFAKGDEGEWQKIPQTGCVVIEDDVEIGSNVAIDRGTLGETRISCGVKLDNLIHVAHNVRVGPNTVIAAQTGISGSTVIGTSNMIAGQVGIVGHIETAGNVIIEAQSGVSKSILKPGRYFGHPAKEHAVALRQEGALRQLPDLLGEIREMKRRIEELEEAVGNSEFGMRSE